MATIDNYINKFVKETGHLELSNVPIATFGHSSATTFAAWFADYNKD